MLLIVAEPSNGCLTSLQPSQEENEHGGEDTNHSGRPSVSDAQCSAHRGHDCADQCRYAQMSQPFTHVRLIQFVTLPAWLDLQALSRRKNHDGEKKNHPKNA